MRPIFIVIEGADGTGGTTQVALLARWAAEQGAVEVVVTREPSDGPVGKLIRQALDPAGPASVLSDSVLPLLFAADRQDHLDRVILPALARGAVVISDRYYHSSMAYQSTADGWSMERIVQLNAGFKAPDLTLILELDPEESLSRIHARGEALERFESIGRLTQIHNAYLSVARICQLKGQRVEMVDASRTIEQVHAQIIAQVERSLADHILDKKTS